MITIQGKEFRNFAEQINKNKEDIREVEKGETIVINNELKPYLVLISGTTQQTMLQYFGYAIVYLTQPQYEKHSTEESLPSHILFTYNENTTPTNYDTRTSYFSYDYTSGELRDMFSTQIESTIGNLVLDIEAIHYEPII